MKDWVDLIAVEALEHGWVTPVTHGSRRLAVYDTASGVHVSQALCSHAGANLCDGYFDGHMIECPLHQGAFDVRDGRAICAPATRPIKVYPARIVGGMVQIQV